MNAFRKPFAEQVAAFRLRLADLRPSSAWDDLQRSQHDRAFMVAGAMKADLLADLAVSVDRAISEGTGIEAFRRDFREIVETRGWHGWTGEGTTRGKAWRTQVIYKTNMITSYAAGRWAQLMRAGFALLIYHHGNSREPRPEHLTWDGLVLPKDHPFWASHAPPNGWGCSCFISGARNKAHAKRKGGKPDKKLPAGWQSLTPNTGAPKGIDKGWDYAPGASTSDLINALKDKIAALPAPVAADLVNGWPNRAFDAWSALFSGFVDRALGGHKQENYTVVGALKPEWLGALKARGITPPSAQIAITDKQIQHTFRGTKHVTVSSRADKTRRAKVDPLDLSWFKDLPAHLRSPKAVLLDTRQKTPTLLLIYEAGAKRAKIVVKIAVQLRKADRIMNAVTSGRYVPLNNILSDLGNDVKLIWGKI